MPWCRSIILYSLLSLDRWIERTDKSNSGNCYGPVWTATDRKHGQLIVTALVVAPDNCSYQLANLEALANCT